MRPLSVSWCYGEIKYRAKIPHFRAGCVAVRRPTVSDVQAFFLLFPPDAIERANSEAPALIRYLHHLGLGKEQEMKRQQQTSGFHQLYLSVKMLR